MTPSEALRKEQEEIIQRTGDYIPPYKLNNLMRTAQKILDLLTKTDALVTYKDCEIVLQIVSGAIKSVTE